MLATGWDSNKIPTMSSHTVGKQADWEKEIPSEWNIFQRLASKTHGI